MDGPRVGQILENLVGNAFKYGPPDGLVTIGAATAGEWLAVTVDDEGVGIPATERPLVTEPFHRAWNVRESRIPGTGLGLFISRRLVEAHGGRLRSTTDRTGGPGRGSPSRSRCCADGGSRRAAPGVAASPVAPAPERRGRPWLRRSSSSRTSPSSPRSSSCGWAAPGTGPSVARTGPDALRRFYDDHPDLVILDVALPGLDGWQIIERIREFSRIPILMVTARSSEADKIRGLKLGADDYITKPLSFPELTARVEAALRRAATATPERPRRLQHRDLVVDLDDHRPACAARRSA